MSLFVPDPSTLTTEYLVRNAASLTLDSACTLLSNTTIALSDASREYMKCMFVLIKLMEYKLQILGNTDEENKVWDLILQAKSNLAEAKRKKMLSIVTDLNK
ncbi:hypothetical protein KUTeg_023888 [Tegillarca granosa]|uniref:Direct IAP-binding protein with low pI n=1 Tax=Tegillarca granosa TaxID=220873 RepID=A0ABQ9E2Z5_TEGGR|nr:hypothetical protein KUTeg_023888 [Tegillarca granosa]